MGQSISKAKAKVDETDKDLQALMAILENKRDQFLTLVELSRGEGSNTTKEVQGGRTVSRVSEIRVAVSDGADPGIGDAIAEFFTAAQGGDNAKSAAVKGAEALLSTGINALFGAGSGVGMEKQGFVVLFLNYAFVRIDFKVYTYSVTGTAWGAQANRSGSCYVADIAVLDPMKDIKASEIDFLLAQSFTVVPPEGEEVKPNDNSEWNAIMKMKIQLVQSVILSRMLEKDNLSLADVRDYTEELVSTQKAIQEAFGELADYVPGEQTTGDGAWRKRWERDEVVTPREVLARFHRTALFFLYIHSFVSKLNS